MRGGVWCGCGGVADRPCLCNSAPHMLSMSGEWAQAQQQLLCYNTGRAHLSQHLGTYVMI